MRVRLGLLREYLREAVLMDKSTTAAASTDSDAAVPGHLPNELPKSAALEEQGWVPGRWFPNGYEEEPYDHDRLGDPAGLPAPHGDMDETDERMEGDDKGNGIPDPLTGDDDQEIADHLRGDEEKTSLGDPPEEDPTEGTYNESVEPIWLDSEIKRFMLQEQLLVEYPPGAGMVDPTKPPKGFYTDFDMAKDHGDGDSIHGFWYASPAREKGTDGDPYHDEDPYAQWGFHSPKGPTDGTTHPAVSGEEGVAARKTPEIPELSGGGDTSKMLGANAKPGGGEVGSEGEPEEGEEGQGGEAGEGGEAGAGGQAQGEEQG